MTVAEATTTWALCHALRRPCIATRKVIDMNPCICIDRELASEDELNILRHALDPLLNPSKEKGLEVKAELSELYSVYCAVDL